MFTVCTATKTKVKQSQNLKTDHYTKGLPCTRTRSWSSSSSCCFCCSRSCCCFLSFFFIFFFLFFVIFVRSGLNSLGAVLTAKTKKVSNVRFLQFQPTLKIINWISGNAISPADPGNLTPGVDCASFCHSTASEASLRMCDSSTQIKMFSGLISVWIILHFACR